MLDKLYLKLYFIFTCGIMMIISIIICVVLNNHINIEKTNDSTFFQRMSTLLIYQLENNSNNYEEVVQDYEQEYSIFCAIKKNSGETIYQSSLPFPTSTDFLLSSLNKLTNRVSTVNLTKQTITEQKGTFEIKGQNHDIYLGVPATVISKDNNVYNLAMLYQSRTVTEFLRRQVPLYISVWFISLVCVMFLCRLVLKKALAPTESVLKSQKEFVASASHELKSPLAVIVANVEKINKLDLNDMELQKSVTTMDTECMRMSKLINEMLFLASSDAKTWSVSKKEINVDTLLISLYETYEPICVKQNISLNLDINKITYPLLYSDPERMTQILNIFMDNAIHHSDNSPSIQIQTALTTKNITFYVVDHGHGISEQDRPFIFDRFYCADKSRTDKSNFGLGLSIADELSKMLNGKIGFQDTDSGGSTFYLTIPLK